MSHYAENQYEELDPVHEPQYEDEEDQDPEFGQQAPQQKESSTKFKRTSSLSTRTADTETSLQRAAERERKKHQIREGLTKDPELDQDRKQMWKLFGIETSVGKELFNLYRCGNQPKINYPVPKQKKPEPVQKVVKPCPQKTQIEYPSLYPEPTRKYHMIDFVPKRKREEEIRKEIEEYYKGRKFFRPKIRGIDRKKLIEELQLKFKHQRGALPKGAELPVIDMKSKDVYLSAEETKTNAIRRTHKKDLYFNGLKPDKDEGNSQQSFEPEIELQMLFDQIVSEIEERQIFLEEIQHLDEPKLKQKIKDEIIERVSELQKVQELKSQMK